MKTENNVPELQQGMEPRNSWQKPGVEVLRVEETAGDPTISDDGLGDGLFLVS